MEPTLHFDDLTVTRIADEISSDTLRIIQPEVASVLHCVPQPYGFTIEFQRPAPNDWHRFWQRVLLGWTWEMRHAK